MDSDGPRGCQPHQRFLTSLHQSQLHFQIADRACPNAAGALDMLPALLGPSPASSEHSQWPFGLAPVPPERSTWPLGRATVLPERPQWPFGRCLGEASSKIVIDVTFETVDRRIRLEPLNTVPLHFVQHCWCMDMHRITIVCIYVYT